MSASPTTLAPEPAPAVSPPLAGRSTWRKWLPYALFSILWLDLIRLLSTQWEAREQYAYGWFVPIFAAALFFRRWQDRPRRAATVLSSVSLHPLGGKFLLGVLTSAALLFILPLRVVYEINADWPLMGWLYAGITVLLTLYVVYVAGGWKWVRHFAFPICFILIAVVWPHRIEKGLTQGLMRIVATLTVELLGWLDIPAIQHGNLIELGTGTVGVDEACSGIRSFQSSLMAGLLMGELYRLRFGWRALLVVSGLAVGFCLNVVRTLVLSWQASKEGLSAIDKWHDPAGLSITVVCFFCLWGIATFLRRIDEHPTLIQSPADHPSLGLANKRVQFFAATVGVWIVLCLGATAAWYRYHEIDTAGLFHWSVAAPESAPGFEKLDLPPRTVKLLKFDSAVAARWQESDASEWTMYFFRWNPTSASSIFNARQHRPDVCLPASGLKLIEKPDQISVPLGDVSLPFECYIYESGVQTLHVFFCQWEDGQQEQTGLAGSEQSGRVITALKGRRHLGQQSLEFILAGYKSMSDAEAALRAQLPSLVRFEPALPAAEEAHAR